MTRHIIENVTESCITDQQVNEELIRLETEYSLSDLKQLQITFKLDHLRMV